MDNALYYLAVNRQGGLPAEMDIVANNIANLNTTAFRREGLAFSEFVVASRTGESLSMADPGARFASALPGTVTTTGGRFDLAIEGDGYFLVGTAEGTLLTRAGAFQLSPDGFVVTPSGGRVLDIGAAPIAVPPGAASILVAADGTVSADGEPVAQIAVVDAPPDAMRRHGDTAFTVTGNVWDAVAAPKVRQGALEHSNVNAVTEIARMIEVTRAYEMAQSLITDEDDRIRQAVRTLGERV